MEYYFCLFRVVLFARIRLFHRFHAFDDVKVYKQNGKVLKITFNKCGKYRNILQYNFYY